jgi:hypothetical protein
MTARTTSDNDLTAKEQTNVRTALKFLHSRMGGWEPLAKVLRFNQATLGSVASGHKVASASMAVRVAKLVKVTVDDVLLGKFPEPGTCPHCGHRPNVEPQAETPGMG